MLNALTNEPLLEIEMGATTKIAAPIVSLDLRHLL